MFLLFAALAWVGFSAVLALLIAGAVWRSRTNRAHSAPVQRDLAPEVAARPSLRITTSGLGLPLA